MMSFAVNRILALHTEQCQYRSSCAWRLDERTSVVLAVRYHMHRRVRVPEPMVACIAHFVLVSMLGLEVEGMVSVFMPWIVTLRLER